MKKIILGTLFLLSLGAAAVEFTAIIAGPWKFSKAHSIKMQNLLETEMSKKQEFYEAEHVEYTYTCLNQDLSNLCSTIFFAEGGSIGSFFILVDDQTLKLRKIYWN